VTRTGTAVRYNVKYFVPDPTSSDGREWRLEPHPLDNGPYSDFEAANIAARKIVFHLCTESEIWWMLRDTDGLHTYVATEGESVNVRCITARAEVVRI
jgi:hypothetical protein